MFPKPDSLRPIDPLLLKADLPRGVEYVEIETTFLSKIAKLFVVSALVFLFGAVNIGSSMNPTFGNFHLGFKIPTELTGGIGHSDVVLVSVEGRDFPWLNKRVVAVGGDTITFSQGEVILNGKVLDEPYLADGEKTWARVPILASSKYATQLKAGCLNYGNMNRRLETSPYVRVWECELAENYLFVLGDNRDHSFDSRQMGPVHVSQIVAQTVFKCVSVLQFWASIGAIAAPCRLDADPWK